MQLVLDLVSRSSRVQTIIRQEISNVIGEDSTSPITAKQLNELKYLRATIREVQR